MSGYGLLPMYCYAFSCALCCALEASISVNNATALGLSYIVMGLCTGATAWYYLSYHSALRQLIFQGPMQPGELGTRLIIIYVLYTLET